MEEKNIFEMNRPRLPQKRTNRAIHIAGAACLFLALFFICPPNVFTPWNKSALPFRYIREDSTKLPQCPQVDPLVPVQSTPELSAMDVYLQSDDFKNISISRLVGAVKIPTMSYDDMGPADEDPRFEIFYEFAAYLKNTFPHVHSKLTLENVNVHGLLYTWTGLDPSLQPTILMAHQDVVPVPESTIPAWTYPPFEGFFDGTYIWGRGSSDCKDQLIAILEAVEELIKAGYTPERTLVLPFGFDEEISGTRGAGSLSKFLLERYGKNSMAVIVDEGAGSASEWGSTFAMPGVAEKGHVDVDIVVRLPGGHSSIPPEHSGIGVMAELITLIEGDPYEPRLFDENPFLGLLRCGAEHSPEFPPKLKKLLGARDLEGRYHSIQKSKSYSRDELAIEASKYGLGVKYLMTTSLAVDLVSGGVKVNALPERTKTTVNHRVNVGENTAHVLAKHRSIAQKIADKYNLTLHAFNGKETPSSISLSTAEDPLEPAPVTPTIVDPISAYSVLSGTTRALYGREMLVSPGIMTGNTDTRFYWDLSRHIFRYRPGWDGEPGLGNIHTVDEKVSIKGHIASVRWFSLFIRNMDEAALR